MPYPHQIQSSIKSYVDLLARFGLLVDPSSVDELHDAPISLCTCDSREARKDTLFVCKGSTFKREYLQNAIEAGASYYVSEKDYRVSAPCLLVNDVRKAMAVIADKAWNHPSGQVQVCAFTGTKGKSTSSYYLRGILDAQAKIDKIPRPALISGIEIDDGIGKESAKLTTPEAFDLQRHLANAVASGARHVVMEASSQALKYDRTYGVEFAVGAFTNFGEDHISPIEHPTIEDYFNSKLRLFSQSRIAVVNLDISCAKDVLEAANSCESTITYSINNTKADVFARSIQHSDSGIIATVRTPRFERQILIPTPVKFNVSNALGAIACAEALNIPEECIVHGLKDVFVPGRMNLYPTASGNIIGIVDYAHNGMSLETLLNDLRENYPERELCVVFGATGGKGIDRRETMGIAAGKFADRIVITEDDPGPENPDDICSTIAHFVEQEGNHSWQIIVDREKAIKTAVHETNRPAVVVVTGKGCDTYMLRKEGAVPHVTDGETLRCALDAFENKHR